MSGKGEKAKITSCVDVFEQSVFSVKECELIKPVSAEDRVFHFQN